MISQSGLCNLKTVIERAMAIKVIQESSFARKKEYIEKGNKFRKGEQEIIDGELKRNFKSKFERIQKESAGSVELRSISKVFFSSRQK